MSDFSAIFIRLRDEEEQDFEKINSVLLKEGYLFTLRYHETRPWVQLGGGEAESMPYYVKNIAAIFPDRRIIGISCQSVVDAIGFWEIVDGQEKRILEYGFLRERTWEKVEGEPGDWEAEIFSGREGYDGPESLKPGETMPYFTNFDVDKLGRLLDLPGFGVPAYGEQWTKEVFN